MTLSSLLSNPNRKPNAAALNSRLARTLPFSPLSQYSSSSILSSPPPSSSPPTEFASPLSPAVPGQGRARLENHEEMLQRLDEVYGRNEHPMLDGFRFIGAGGVGNPYPKYRQARVEDDDEDYGGGGVMGEAVGSPKPAPVFDDGRWEGDMNEGVDVRAQKAMTVLQNQIRDRMPYVRAASMRLQAVMGLRNELAFDLPELRRPIPSPFNGFSPNSSPLLYTPDAGAAARTLARNGFSPSPYNFNPLSPLSPLNTPNVDPQTGKGLREWLLSKGKEFGMRKKECRSISFHDFTPDIRNNSWSNKLLGHFVGEGARERVDFYEVDLPTTMPDPTTGRPIPTTQTWLWFLISRPLLIIDPKNTSTRPRSHSKISHPASVSSTPQTFHTPATHPSASPTPWPASQTPTQHPNNEQGRNTLPPNFPLPVPTSWMVFACPLENVTAYPETIESTPPSTSTSTSSSIPPPLHKRNSFPPNFQHGNGGKKIHKRRDFDISHNGIPLFEFSLKSSNCPFPHSENLPPFLEVGELGPFYQGDEFEAYEEMEYEVMVQEATAPKNYLGDEIPGLDGFVPSPNSGYWWRAFYRLVEQDAERWKEVKMAMARGKCRVVVRYDEFDGELDLMEEGGDVDVDVEMEDGVFGLGIEFEEGSGGGVLGVAKKRERLVGRQRVTRSEARRRSGLGLSEVSNGGVVMGVGAPMGESARSRAIGNKDLSAGGVGLGVGVGKGGKKGGGKK